MTPARPCCARCLRPLSTCLCNWIAPTPTDCEVLILQHPLEVAQAKGSARLLHLSLTNSRLAVGETFDPEALQQWLRADGRTSMLLYPADADYPTSQPPSAGPAQLRLVVLDGTWRKSRKMLHLNPALGQLPRLALHAPPPSQYLIRKAQRPGQLSTLEATCLALQQLEAAPQDRFSPVLDAFHAFVASQLR